MFEIEFKFSRFSKALDLGVSETAKRLDAQSAADTLRKRQGKQAFIYQRKWNTPPNIPPTNNFSLLENCQLYTIPKHESSNC